MQDEKADEGWKSLPLSISFRLALLSVVTYFETILI